MLGAVRATRTFKIVLALMLGALAIETVAYVWYGIAAGAFYGAGAVFRTEDLSPPAEHAGWWERDRMRVQPFTGFTDFGPSDERNIHPPRHEGPAIVIGVLGGYVANGVAQSLRQAVAARLSEIGVDIEPLVVDLAIGQGRQPQQLMSAINLLAHGGHFDVVVNLDGLDDMSPLDPDELLAFAPEVIGGTAAAMERYVAATALREERRRVLRTAQGWLGFSAAFGLALRSRLDGLESDIREYGAAAGKRPDLRQNGREALTPREALFAAARLWYRSSVLTGRLAQAAGADYYHFLQPSRYVSGSERPTIEESADVLAPDLSREARYAAMHPVLVQLGREMTRQGTTFVDLTSALRVSDETLYAGAMHLSHRGNALLAQRIATHIEPSIVARARALDRTSDSPRGTVSDVLQARAHFDVFLRGAKHLVYKRDSCAEEDTAPPFFLHVLPRNPDDLERSAAEHGFENLDFDFNFYANRGIRIGERCTVERRLPDYDVEQLRTGQYDTEAMRNIWQAQIHLGARSLPFKVFRRGVHGLVYKKADCTSADVRHAFFLHVRPVRGADTGGRAITEDGYVNLDFPVSLADVLRDDGSCVIEQRVPFEFVELTTGQLDAQLRERLWQRDIDRV